MAVLPTRQRHPVLSLTHHPNPPSLYFSSPFHFSFFSSPYFLTLTMATLRSLASASPVSHYVQQPRLCSGSVSWAPFRSSHSAFNGKSLRLPRLRSTSISQKSQTSGCIRMMVKPTIQFIQGTDEMTVPDVKLTKSRDGTNGMAIFNFEEPSVFDSSGELGDITGFFMIDEEGVLQSVDVSAKFINGKPARIEAKYVMRTPREWDRFMRFMERYANANGLQFVKK